MAKRKFRKVYLICTDNDVFGGNIYEFVNMYRRKEYAEMICKQFQDRAISDSTQQSEKGKPISIYKLHGFFLVHESFFEDK